MNGSENGIILFEVALIALAVVLVDDIGVRAAMAIVPGLLLAQRAMQAGARDDGESGTGSEDRVPNRRGDQETREHVAELITHFRQFYATCHLFGQNEISAAEAQERTASLEKDLNRLLAKMTTGVKVRKRLS